MAVAVSLLIWTTGCGQNALISETTESLEKQRVAAVEEAREGSADEQTSAEEKITGDELSCLLPAGFVALDGEEGLFVSEEYPKDIACIGYVIAPHDSKITELSESELKNSIEQDLRSGYGTEVEVTVKACENLQIDGHEAIKTELSYRIMETDYEQIQVIIVDEANEEEHIFGYIQEKGGKWMDKFRQSIETITF